MELFSYLLIYLLSYLYLP